MKEPHFVNEFDASCKLKTKEAVSLSLSGRLALLVKIAVLFSQLIYFTFEQHYKREIALNNSAPIV